MEGRIVELELRYMELKKLVDELSGIVAAQERTIERLSLQLGAATAKLRDLSAKADGPAPDEPPPHY